MSTAAACRTSGLIDIEPSPLLQSNRIADDEELVLSQFGVLTLTRFHRSRVYPRSASHCAQVG
jgi:hypothetical protein